MRRWVPGLVVLVLIAAAWAAAQDRLPSLGTGSVTAAAPGSPEATAVRDLLARVAVVPDRTRPGGYQRGCGAGEACVFGPSWSDDHPGEGGHNGCDTRNDVLARDLREVTFRPGTRDCVVVSGVLDDPYTGSRIDFVKAEANRVQIDHIFPLAAAWDLGADRWSADRRRAFANDIAYNLLAVDGPTNQSKGDATPARWMPPNTTAHCWYASRYLSVAVRWELPVTTADRDALDAAAATCP